MRINYDPPDWLPPPGPPNPFHLRRADGGSVAHPARQACELGDQSACEEVQAEIDQEESWRLQTQSSGTSTTFVTTVTNYTSTGTQVDKVTRMVQWIAGGLDSRCRSWLDKGYWATRTSDLTVDGVFLSLLTRPGAIGVGNISAPVGEVNHAVYGPRFGVPSAGLLTINNAAGSFFGNGRTGNLRDRIKTILHEIAHWTGAIPNDKGVDFNGKPIPPGQSERNTAKVKLECARTINKVSGAIHQYNKNNNVPKADR